MKNKSRIQSKTRVRDESENPFMKRSVLKD